MKNKYHKIILASAVIFLGISLSNQALAADATISGTVTHASDGTPVDTVIVYAENSATGELDYDVSDAAGSYSITINDDSDGTNGNYLIYNYISTSTEVNVVFYRTEQTVTLIDGETRAGINLSLTRRGRFEGYVYESDGTTPINNALAYYTRSTYWTDGFGSDYSTASGFYSVSPAPYLDATLSALGRYDVTVAANGYFGAREEDILLDNEETAYPQNFILTKATTITGSVKNNNDTPLAGAALNLQLNESAVYNTYLADADDNGNFTVLVFDQYDYNGTAVGNYTLTASADGYVSESVSVAITADESALTGYDFTLRQGGTMTGQVTTVGDLLPLADVSVTATDGYGNTFTTTTDADGNYTFSNLPDSDNYTLTLSISGYLTESKYGISVAKGDTTNVEEVRLTEAVTFSGSVLTKPEGEAVSGATVKLFNRAKPRSSSADYTATTVTDGSFNFSAVAHGHYRVEVTKNGYVTLRREQLDLTNDVSDRNFRLPLSAIIFGRVTVGGEGVYQALVSVYSKNPATIGYGADYTDSDGYYYITSIKPAKYRIRVISTNYVDKTISQRLELGENEVNITVGEAGSISGYVTEQETGLPLSSYLVRVRHKNNSAYTDANGYYIIDGLAPGKYKLYIYSTVHQTGRAGKVTVKAKTVTKSVNFSLQKK